MGEAGYSAANGLVFRIKKIETTDTTIGGADTLRAAGVEVEQGLMFEEARELNRVWTFAVDHGRPFVTWKFATSLDGRSAAVDGTSRWISGAAARRQARAPGRRQHADAVGAGALEGQGP